VLPALCYVYIIFYALKGATAPARAAQAA
jgi:fucose permease